MTLQWLESGLCPTISISDQNGTERYRWEHPLIYASPRQDVRLTSWDIRAGLDSDAGSATVVLQDNENRLTDQDHASRRLKIRNGWQLEIWLQKPNGGAQHKWFHGIIEQPVLERPGNARQAVTITAIGWGVRLAHRFGSVDFYQRKLSDGINLDGTDADARASEIVKRIITDTDILVSPGSPPLGITVNGVDDLNIRMPDYSRRFQSLGLMINELAQSVGCVYGVNPDRDMFFHVRRSRASGFLISNDIDELAGWPDPERAAVSRNAAYIIRESAIGTGYSTLIGLGALHEEITSSRAPTDTVGTPLDLPAGTNTAFSFRLGRTRLSKIAVRLSRTAACTSTLFVTLAGSDTGSAIDAGDVRGAAAVPPGRLNRELAADGTPSYIEVSFGREPLRLSPHADMHVIISGTADPVRLHRSGTGTVQRRASDSDAAWAAVSGGAPHYRAYAAETMHVIAQDTSRRGEGQGHKETTYPLHDFPSEHSAIQAFEGLLNLVGSVRRSYDSIIISAPGARPQPGSTVRLHDTFNGLDTTVELIGYRIGAHGGEQLAAASMSIDVEEWIAP